MVNTVESRGRFDELLQEAKCSEPPGVYGIEIKKVLAVGGYYLNQPEVAIVEDLNRQNLGNTRR